VVDSPVELQYQRLQKRNGLAPRQIDQILRAQLNREIRLASADDIIDNSKDLDALTHQVHKLHEFYLSLV
jgi:dephospho-CoA kinase